MMMTTFLPPISRWTFLNEGAAFSATVRPTSVDPVKDTTRMSSLTSKAFPTSSPPPVTRLTTPRGTPASSRILTKLSADSGVSVAGLKTTVLPQTSAGMIFHDGIAIGKFHGVMTAQTPSGCRIDMANLSRSSDGTVCPYWRRPSPAMKNVMSTASCTSPRVSSRILPISRVMSRASASLRSASICAARNSSSARRGAGTSRQCSYARFAASTARSTSALVDFWKWPIRSSEFAGFLSSNNSPEIDGTQAPSMKL